MNPTQQLQAITANLTALTMRQRITLAVFAMATAAGILLFAWLLNTPATSPLYTEIPREELSRMSRILSENGISFQTDLDRGAISVDPRKMENARLLLAEHGLPSGSSAGYELFDKVNSLGLTSFMQEVTKTRAIEGELARTIQMISGIRAARVHLVLPKDRGLRTRPSEVPTASVVISSTASVQPSTATSIRYLVAGAVRGLDISNVTVLRTDGTLVSSSSDDITGGSIRLAELETKYERELADKINAALGSHLGEENYRVSVTAKLNNDQRRTDETIFIPDSRVERSVRVIRENAQSENSSASAGPTTVTENFPDEESGSADGQSARENNEKRDELTNYEISQKKVSTVSEGYQIEKLAVALVVNRGRIEDLLGGSGTDEQVQEKLLELEQTVRAAIGYSEDRGDLIEVNALEFLSREILDAESASSGLGLFLSRNFSTMVNALTAIGGALLLILFVVRPVLAQLAKEPARREGDANAALAPAQAPAALPNVPPGNPAIAQHHPSGDPAAAQAGYAVPPEMQSAAQGSYPPLPPDERGRISEQLVGMIDQSEERAAYIVRDWLSSEQGARG